MRRAAMSAASGDRKDAAVAVGKDLAAQKMLEKAALKGVPVKGLDQALTRPSSIKGWSVVAGRTAVSAGLTAVTGAFGTYIEDFLHRVGYKRLIIWIAALSVVLTISAGFMTMIVVASISETVLHPLSVAASLLGKVPGVGESDERRLIESAPKYLCRPVAVPHAAAAAVPDTVADGAVPATAEEDEPPSDGEGAPEVTESYFVPKVAIGEDGRLTDAAKDLMRHVPRFANPLRTETWMLYVLAHPDDDPNSDWDAFKPLYETSRAYVSSQKNPYDMQKSTSPAIGSSTTDKHPDKIIDSDMTPMELVMGIDPSPFYDPFALAAATMTSSLILDNFLDGDDGDKKAALSRMETACGA